MESICALPQYQHFLIILIVQLAYMSLEFWLGKTEKTKASSVLELAINLIRRK